MTASEMHLGEPALDEDHAELQRLIQGLLASTAETRVAALDAMRQHARKHFGTEDEDLRAMRDGNAQCHIDEHANVLKSLDEVHDLLVGDAATEEQKERVAQSLSVQLLEWLPYHVQEMDTAVAVWRSKQRFGGAPVQIQRRVR